MKKLIVLFAILAMVNVASAGYVDIQISSLNGEPITAVREITIGPSDTVNMDIIYYGDTSMWLYAFAVDVYQNDLLKGSLTPGSTQFPITWPTGVWNFDTPPEGSNWQSGTQANLDGSVGAWATGQVNGLPGAGLNVAAIAVDHILFHCLGAGDVTIMLRPNESLPSGGSVEINSAMDPFPITDFGTGVIIHQIPEPMTLVLLGLGSLFLARRKK